VQIWHFEHKLWFTPQQLKDIIDALIRVNIPFEFIKIRKLIAYLIFSTWAFFPQSDKFPDIPWKSDTVGGCFLENFYSCMHTYCKDILYNQNKIECSILLQRFKALLIYYNISSLCNIGLLY